MDRIESIKMCSADHFIELEASLSIQIEMHSIQSFFRFIEPIWSH